MFLRTPKLMEGTSEKINTLLKNWTPLQIVIGSIGSYLFAKKLYELYSLNDPASIKDQFFSKGYQLLIQMPFVGDEIEFRVNSEITPYIDDVRSSISEQRNKHTNHSELLAKGLDKKQILQRFTQIDDAQQTGRESGAIYTIPQAELKAILAEIYSNTAFTNPMHAKWPQLKMCESEVIAICHELMNSPLKHYRSQLSNNLEAQERYKSEAFTKIQSNQIRIKQYENTIKKLKNNLELQNNETNLQLLEYTKGALKKFKRQCLIKLPAYMKYYALEKERQQLEKKLSMPGIITHGGSFSILEACFAYARQARENGITHPVIIAPENIHVAFDKAAEILNLKIIKARVNNQTGQVSLKSMRQLIKQYSGNIALIAASAPSFPYGIIDPIPDIAALAREHQLPLHVDHCLGGFLTAFINEHPYPMCDFSVPGVSSISMDTHKYGQTPKGSSVLLFHPDNNVSTVHCYLRWVGGFYATQGIDGSRSGADIATTWATLHYYGRDYYKGEAIKITELRAELEDKVSQIPGLELVYKHDNFKLNVVGFRSNQNLNLLVIQNHLKKNGWNFQIMQTSSQKVEGLHFCLTSVHTSIKEFKFDFIADIKEATKYARTQPYCENTGTLEVYSKMPNIPLFAQRKLAQAHVDCMNTALITTPQQHT